MAMEPSSVLGPTHPLTRAMRDGAAVARQARAAVTLLVAALTASLNGLAWAWAGVVGGVAVLAMLGSVALAARLRARWAAREVIAGGGERLPLAPIERERERLLGAVRERRGDAARGARAPAPPARAAVLTKS